MRILLDTQCWLWMAAAPDRLSPAARAMVESADHDLLLSAASAWEIAIKYALRRLTLPEPPEQYVPGRMMVLRTDALPIEHRHALRVSVLPGHHRDPFDRVLIAQALVDDLPVLTADPLFQRYGVTVIQA